MISQYDIVISLGMTIKHTTLFRYDDAIRLGLEVVKERYGTPYHEQIRRAVVAWIKAQGVELEDGSGPVDRNGARAERVARLTEEG